MTTSNLFTVHDVMIDSSIQFIDVADLRRLKGRNIFKVDINKLQAKIQQQYPQVAELRVMRELPDRIKVLAKKRDILFQTMWKGKMLLVDAEGVAMYYTLKAVDLPLVQGLLGPQAKVSSGYPINVKSLGLVLGIIHNLKAHPHTAGLKVTSMDITNLAKINVVFSVGLRIILDEDQYGLKLGMLEMLMAQRKIDFVRVKYIDLRFHEPVLGENNV